MTLTYKKDKKNSIIDNHQQNQAHTVKETNRKQTESQILTHVIRN